MDQLQAQQLATQAAIEQRNHYANENIELRVQLTMVSAQLTELKAQADKGIDIAEKSLAHAKAGDALTAKALKK